MNYEVINGDNINKLKNYADNYFDSVVTDPPYGLGKEPNASELMKDWIEHGYHEIEGKGFMGKEWDAFVPQPIFWKEVFRVLKPGGHVLAFYGTRTYDWGVMAMRFAGFEVRDCIQWLYGSGFPKSHNISKSLDKLEGAEREVIGKKERGSVEEAKERGVGFLSDPANRNNTKQFGYGTELITEPSTDAAKQWDGWGTALKPANEPIVLARKPLEKGLSIAENILKWGVGGINIDASRISGIDPNNAKRLGKDYTSDNTNFGGGQIQQRKIASVGGNLEGRFPANIILTHHEDCVCKGTKKVKSDGHHSGKVPDNGGLYNLGLKPLEDKGNIHAENGMEEVENWDCHEDCPIRILDEQSGVTKSSPRTTCDRRTNSTHEYGFKSDAYSPHNDKGGASRFFYVAKASKSERNKGLDGFEAKFAPTMGDGIGVKEHNEETSTKKQNFHPTVKPIKLMQYLVKMITPTNGIVLDPFCGSGSTGVACKLDGFNFVGIEQDLEYTKIAEARIKNTQIEQKQLEIF